MLKPTYSICRSKVRLHVEWKRRLWLLTMFMHCQIPLHCKIQLLCIYWQNFLCLFLLLTNFLPSVRLHNAGLSIMYSPFNLIVTTQFPQTLSQLQLMSPHISFKLQILLCTENENIHIRIDSLNRCHGNIIVIAAITALCLTNGHKSSSFHKEDVVVLHSHPIIRNCPVWLRDEWLLKRPILVWREILSLLWRHYRDPSASAILYLLDTC